MLVILNVQCIISSIAMAEYLPICRVFVPGH